MAHPPLSAAIQRMQRHREEMQLAIAEGLTLDAARERLSSYREQQPRLQAPSPGSAAMPHRAYSSERTAPAELAQAEERPLPWWQRD